MSQASIDIAAIAAAYQLKKPQDIIAYALETFDNIAISFSGAEDVILVDMACKIKKDIQIYYHFVNFRCSNEKCNKNLQKIWDSFEHMAKYLWKWKKFSKNKKIKSI